VEYDVEQQYKDQVRSHQQYLNPTPKPQTQSSPQQSAALISSRQEQPEGSTHQAEPTWTMLLGLLALLGATAADTVEAHHNTARDPLLLTSLPKPVDIWRTC